MIQEPQKWSQQAVSCITRELDRPLTLARTTLIHEKEQNDGALDLYDLWEPVRRQ